MKNIGIYFIFIAFAIVIVLLQVNGCEDSRAEKESDSEHIPRYFCEDCRRTYPVSGRDYTVTHKCSNLYSKETDLKLKRLAADIKKYGINYPTEPNEVWGQGDPDPNHIKYFGNDNLSRLCFVQTQRINRQANLIAELITLNAKQHKILGKSDIDLYNRVRKLEDPNGPKKSKTSD